MRTVLVGMVALVSAAGGIAACGNNDKTTPKTTVAQTAGAELRNIEKIADITPTDKSDSSVTGGGLEKTSTFTLVLGEGKGGFKFRSMILSDDAKAKIDDMFEGGKVDLATAHFEIEGYTDNLGTEKVNREYGLARAKAVKQYLGEQYEVPADWIKVVSYGMENPVGDNSTPEGRAKNRRVVIKVVD